MKPALLVLLAACDGGGSGGADPADTATTDALCEGAPVVTWDDWGRGFLTEHCDTCHLSTSADREGAPHDVIFDTEDDVASVADRMLVVATGEAPSMPPQGGVSEDDRLLLQIWLTCDL